MFEDLLEKKTLNRREYSSIFLRCAALTIAFFAITSMVGGMFFIFTLIPMLILFGFFAMIYSQRINDIIENFFLSFILGFLCAILSFLGIGFVIGICLIFIPGKDE